VNVEDELNAFYSDMGAVLTSTGKAETKSIFSVSDMVSTSNNHNKSNSSPKKNQDSELNAFYADLEIDEQKINTSQSTSKINFIICYFSFYFTFTMNLFYLFR
jgi:hypothetical protein